MRLIAFVLIIGVSSLASAQPPGKFPPDSLINTQVIPRTTPVIQVIGTMRNFAFGLGVRCQFCHVGKEGMPLEQFDFVSDEIQQKKTARIMMRLTEDINKQLDAAVPRQAAAEARVTCITCHRGKSTPDNTKPQ